MATIGIKVHVEVENKFGGRDWKEFSANWSIDKRLLAQASAMLQAFDKSQVGFFDTVEAINILVNQEIEPKDEKQKPYRRRYSHKSEDVTDDKTETLRTGLGL